MSAPPSAALRLLREGHSVARVIEWTGCNRWHLVLALHAEGMYVDRATDTAQPLPVEKTGTPWRDWARQNGYPSLGEAGWLPNGLMDAYIEANPDDVVAARSHRRAVRRNRRTA